MKRLIKFLSVPILSTAVIINTLFMPVYATYNVNYSTESGSDVENLSYSEIPEGYSVSCTWQKDEIETVECTSFWDTDTHQYEGFKSSSEMIIEVKNTSVGLLPINVHLTFSSKSDSIEGGLKESEDCTEQINDLYLVLGYGETKSLWLFFEDKEKISMVDQTVEVGTISCRIDAVIGYEEPVTLTVVEAPVLDETTPEGIMAEDKPKIEMNNAVVDTESDVTQKSDIKEANSNYNEITSANGKNDEEKTETSYTDDFQAEKTTSGSSIEKIDMSENADAGNNSEKLSNSDEEERDSLSEMTDETSEKIGYSAEVEE